MDAKAMSAEELIEDLDRRVVAGWARVRGTALWRHIEERGFDQRLYRLVLVQMYHYARHNSVNQAFAAWRVPPERTALLQFCYRHAWREGDLVVWDNRCVLHRGTPYDTVRHRRFMQRTTVSGDPAEPPAAAVTSAPGP